MRRYFFLHDSYPYWCFFVFAVSYACETRIVLDFILTSLSVNIFMIHYLCHTPHMICRSIVETVTAPAPLDGQEHFATSVHLIFLVLFVSGDSQEEHGPLGGRCSSAGALPYLHAVQYHTRNSFLRFCLE
jgi:hypothetical protein